MARENPGHFSSEGQMFTPGEEVVCIDDSPTNIFGDCDLVKGKRYIVEWIGMFQHFNYPEILCVSLVGLSRSIPAVFRDIPGIADEYPNSPFRATRFAPIQKKTTNISALESLLVPTKILEDA